MAVQEDLEEEKREQEDLNMLKAKRKKKNWRLCFFFFFLEKRNKKKNEKTIPFVLKGGTADLRWSSVTVATSTSVALSASLNMIGPKHVAMSPEEKKRTFFKDNLKTSNAKDV